MIKLKRYGLAPTVSVESAISNVVYNLEFIAKLAHGINDTYRSLIGETALGDWDSLEPEVKASSLKGVAFIVKNPQATPAETHAKWVEERTCEGWSFGDVMDESSKTHPCLIAYEELPVEHRMKDHLFRSTVLSVLEALKEDQQLAVSMECDCGSYSPGTWN